MILTKLQLIERALDEIQHFGCTPFHFMVCLTLPVPIPGEERKLT